MYRVRRRSTTYLQQELGLIDSIEMVHMYFAPVLAVTTRRAIRVSRASRAKNLGREPNSLGETL